jgi:hypothetical protein
MYNRAITDKQLLEAGKQANIKLVRYDDDRLDEMLAKLELAVQDRDKNGVALKHRQLNPYEQAFIKNERLVCKYDFEYFFKRYCHTQIKLQGQPVVVARVNKLLEPQRLFLEHLSLHEKALAKGKATDGYMFIACKARQEGYTTVARGITMHRAIFWEDTRALAASVDDTMVLELYDRDHTIYDNLPWWLKPVVEYDQKGAHFTFGKMKSSITYAQGNQKGGVGTGKGQLTSAGILTPTGWATFGDIRVGDKVVGSDGFAYSVTGVFPRGKQQTYKVIFSDDTSIICDAEHLWSVQSNKQHYRNTGYYTFSVKDLLKEGLRTGPTKRKQVRWYIPLVKPIQFRERKHFIDPYVLGVLLGDGSLTQKTVSFTSEDDMSFVQTLLPEGVLLKRYCHFNRSPHWSIVSPKTKSNPVKQELIRLGVFGHGALDKFVPKEYLFSSIEGRTAVLQGLLDTDGTASGGGSCIEFCSISTKLASDVQFLVQSLGGTARIVEQLSFINSHGTRVQKQDKYQVYISLPNEIEGFRLERKKTQYTKRTKYHPKRNIVSIEPTGYQETVCISVDSPDSLYVTEHCIVTHNTIPVNHITELGLWEEQGANPEKLLFDLDPTWPQSPDTFVLFESTSNGRLNFWFNFTMASVEGRTRFKVVFCPWYAEPQHNRKKPPYGWVPMARTQAMMETVKRTSPGYFFGKTIELDAEQAYWWEDRYEEFRGLGRTAYFLSNYPTTLEESFQVSGNRAFSVETIDSLRQGVKGAVPYEFSNFKEIGKIA